MTFYNEASTPVLNTRDKPCPLNGFLVLSVAPYLHYADIQALRHTSPIMRGLLDEYECSTASAALLTKDFAPSASCEVILSSIPVPPGVVFPSYRTLGDLEDRHRKITQIVDEEKYLKYGWWEVGMAGASEAESDSFRSGIKRGIWISSQLADLDPLERVRRRIDAAYLPDRGCPHQFAPPEYGDCQHEVHDGDNSSNAESEVVERILIRGTDYEPAGIPCQDVRAAQLEAVQNMSTSDLASLISLGYLASRGFEIYLCHSRLVDHPTHVLTEWACAVAENTFRHGIGFLHAQAHRASALLEHSDMARQQLARANGTAAPMDLDDQIGQQLPDYTPDWEEMQARADIRAARRRRKGLDKAGGCKQDCSSFESEICSVCSIRMATRAAGMVRDVISEIRLWEWGELDMLPGLGMTIRSEFRERTRCSVEDTLLKAVAITSGKEKVEE